jgi:soluble lytic murein transglycosylase
MRFSPLLAATCLGTGVTLAVGRAALNRLPPPNPGVSSSALERIHRFAPDPALRREAALLLTARAEGDPLRQRRLLAGQGWGPDPLAAVALKRDALAAEAMEDHAAAEQRWRQLLRRFPIEPAAADALYALGRQQPALRQQLLQRFPAHPAALAAASDADQASHLARWGVRWPGAGGALRRACGQTSSTARRNLLAQGLAELGDGAAALRCLNGTAPSAAAALAIAQTGLRGDGAQVLEAEQQLLALSRRQPSSPEAREAARLLSEGSGSRNLALVRQLPAGLQAGAPVQARLALAAGEAGQLAPALAVLRRWPDDPAVWELQWQLARREALAGRWRQVALLLAPERSRDLPAGLAARQEFWLGLSQWELGRQAAAKRTWEQLLQRHPGGYYGWRAAVRLGRDDGRVKPAPPEGLTPPHWLPLASGAAGLDRLWRLDQRLEAWESWRHQRAGEPPQNGGQLLVEGRLRRGINDQWLGLGQLEQAQLRLPAGQCEQLQLLESSLQEVPLAPVFEQAAQASGVPATLLAAVARQESRFSPSVRSVAGAVGLLQLMPETAAELAGGPLSTTDLEDPRRNARLGARYLAQLLEQWQGNPLLAVASYNAGPGAVTGWIQPGLSGQPELWVEAIPYPETRLYVKKVLGNLWSLQNPSRARC